MHLRCSLEYNNISTYISLQFTFFTPSSPRVLQNVFPCKAISPLHRMSARQPPREMVKKDKFEKKIQIIYKMKNL